PPAEERDAEGHTANDHRWTSSLSERMTERGVRRTAARSDCRRAATACGRSPFGGRRFPKMGGCVNARLGAAVAFGARGPAEYRVPSTEYRVERHGEPPVLLSTPYWVLRTLGSSPEVRGS